MWIYRLLFVCLFVCLCVCTVTDFSAEDKASGVKFCSVVHRRPRQGISHFGELCSPRSSPEAQNRTNRRAEASRRQSPLPAASARGTPGQAIGMCGYTAVPEDVRTCFVIYPYNVSYFDVISAMPPWFYRSFYRLLLIFSSNSSATFSRHQMTLNVLRCCCVRVSVWSVC